MESSKRAAVLFDLAESLSEHGSWTGETHLQKATYILQELLHVGTGFSYVLYKHGPFSFELKDELNRMVVDDILELDPRPPYGPSLAGTATGQRLAARFPSTVASAHPAVSFIAEAIGSADVLDLERLATALYLIKEHPDATDDQIAKHLNALKPHISIGMAQEAVSTIRQLEKDAIHVFAPE